MSDRVDRKLAQVAVAQYGWRHEAEFAAGFLTDAGIPYRLQIDDPALGMSLSATSATIWVRGMDEVRAREVLDIDGHAPRLSGLEGPPRQRARSLAAQPVRQAAGPEGARRSPGGHGVAERLGARERLVATLGALGVSAIAVTGPGAVVTPVVAAMLWLFSAVLASSAVVGRAPSALRGLLRALTGGAP